MISNEGEFLLEGLRCIGFKAKRDKWVEPDEVMWGALWLRNELYQAHHRISIKAIPRLMRHLIAEGVGGITEIPPSESCPVAQWRIVFDKLHAVEKPVAAIRSAVAVRQVCPKCAIKHLGQARALLLETRKGYPTHVAFAMGHMAEAEDEIVVQMPESANEIRLERLKLEADPEYVPDWERLIKIVAIDGMLPGTEGM